MQLRISRAPNLVAVLTALCAGGSVLAQQVDRTVLPIPEPPPPVITELSARDVKPPARFDVKAPQGAPNVVVVLLDDIGFGQSSAFGGPIKMPTLDKLAAGGLRFNNFHTTALCSPTRTALLTGRNHHVNNAGAIMELATAFPGQHRHPSGERRAAGGDAAAERLQHGSLRQVPRDAALGSLGLGALRPLADPLGLRQVLRLHRRRDEPVGAGDLRRDRPRGAPRSLDYHFTVDMTNQAIAWMQAQHSLTPDKPFFMYFATGALHAPHHVPKPYIDRYKGKFDQGWDALREETFARQKKMGIVPQSAELTKRPKEIPSWASQTPDQKKIEARQMETFAGFGEHTDEQVGRLVDALQGMGVMDNTLFIYIVGDNGASAEGGPEGTYNEMMALNGIISTAAINMPHLEAWGDPTTFPHYAIGWAWAGDTPFQWTKQIASHYGGTTNGIVIQWPSRIRDKGGIRPQFTHVTDIAPTVLEAANLPFPTSVNGTAQRPFDGTSMAYSFDDPKAGETHTTQYFEMFGNRGIYHDGWVAAARHSIPWLMVPLPPLTADTWELYHVAEDFSQAHDLAAQNPAKLKEMQDVFTKQAIANHVLPIDDRRSERFDAKIAGRPDLMNGRTSLTVYPGMLGMTENAFINVKNVPFTITAPVELRRREDPGRHHRAGRPVRRMDALHEGREARLRIQLLRRGVDQDRGNRRGARRQARDPLRVRARQSEAGRRRQRDALRRRPESGAGTHPEDAAVRVLGRRGHGRGHGRRNGRLERLQAAGQQVHGQDRQGHGRREALRDGRCGQEGRGGRGGRGGHRPGLGEP